MKISLISAPALALNRGQLLSGSAAIAAVAAIPPRLSASDTYRFRHLAFDITVLSDGEMVVPGNFIAQDAPPSQLSEALSEPEAKAPMARLKTNIPLIRHGNDLILVDVGAGNKFQPTEGLLLGALHANGIERASITKVIVTHASGPALGYARLRTKAQFSERVVLRQQERVELLDGARRRKPASAGLPGCRC